MQRADQISLLWEGNTHSYRRFFLDGRAHNLEVEPESCVREGLFGNPLYTFCYNL